MEEKRHLIKLLLSNLRVEGENLLFDVQKPFDLIVNCSEHLLWRYLVDAFINGNIEYTFSLSHIKTCLSVFGITIPDEETSPGTQT